MTLDEALFLIAAAVALLFVAIITALH